MRVRALLIASSIGAMLLPIGAYLHSPAAQDGKRSKQSSLRVDPGDKGLAVKYYRRISTKLSLPLLDANDVPTGTLAQFIEYLGYKGLTPDDLQDRDPTLLMPRDQAEFAALASQVSKPAEFAAARVLADFQNDNVLVSRFFAPKIVDYTHALTTPPTPGWRKLVRLRPLPGSDAAVKGGVLEAYILFNFVKKEIADDPFKGNKSKNNQVIIVPQVSGGEDTAYFLVYLEAPQYQLGFALQNVAFDLPAPIDYYVPVSCAQCHGHDGLATSPGGRKPIDGIYRRARANYLDTDQWHDAMDFDFSALAGTTTYGVVFDGGRDVTTPAYKRAMVTLRSLNGGIVQQNSGIDTTDFKYKAGKKWVDLHATQDGPVPPAQRALEVTPGVVWSPANAEEQELLKLLNHYCFRCHSSTKYNVFDKAGVRAASFDFDYRLKLPTTDTEYMPQGRELPPADRDRIIGLAQKLFP